MSANPVLWNLDDRGVATVTLNRPEVNNAYDGALIQGVLAAMDDLGSKPLRVVVLKGNGRHFQTGADLRWINGVRPQSPEANEAASQATFEAVQRLNTLPIPTVALVQGGCFGGGTGIAAACDVVVASEDAIFSIAETRWGLMAGIIKDFNGSQKEWKVELQQFPQEAYNTSVVAAVPVYGRYDWFTATGEGRREFIGYNRARHAVLEAAIYATRVQLLPRTFIEDELARLQVIVDKTAGAHEIEAMALEGPKRNPEKSPGCRGDRSGRPAAVRHTRLAAPLRRTTSTTAAP